LKGLISILMLVALCLVLPACGGPVASPTQPPAQDAASLTRQQAQDAVWQALAPNTSSGDRANWQVVEVRQVKGRDVAEEFAGEPSLGCWKGPTPTPNGEIQPGGDYWYVEMSPKPATPLPGATISPTAPPFIPEPFLRQALFLIDLEGNVVARKLLCVIY
jgi:hypothetical protein